MVYFLKLGRIYSKTNIDIRRPRINSNGRRKAILTYVKGISNRLYNAVLNISSAD